MCIRCIRVYNIMVVHMQSNTPIAYNYAPYEGMRAEDF